MTRLLRHLTPYSQIMIAGILILTGVIVLEAAILDLSSATATYDNEDYTGDGPEAATAAPGFDVVSIAPLPTYRELQTRPLFMETRRPAPRQTGGAAAQRVDPARNWKLTAVIVAGEDSHVFVQGIRDKSIRRLKAGDKLDGWLVSEITPQFVTFASAGQEATLELRKEADQR